MGDLRSIVTEPPENLYTVWEEYASVPARKTPQSNFLKGVKWSPDGVCLLTASDDNCMRIFDLPQDEYRRQWQRHYGGGGGGDGADIDPSAAAAVAPCEGSGPVPYAGDAGAGDAGGQQQQLQQPPQQQQQLPVGLRVQESEAVYDWCWFPGMSSADPSSCCFLTTCRAHPIHLWDACSGALRCSYCAYDAADEVTAAYAIAVDPRGEALVSGHSRAINVFAVSRPGRQYAALPTHKKGQDGQQGIISCFSFNPDRSGLLAAGSYAGGVGLYAVDTREALAVMEGHAGGVTQVAFSPDGNYLYSGARRDPHLYCWDVRHTLGPVYRLQRRTAATNQRVAFDIEPCGRHLVTGGEDGVARLFDLRDGSEVAAVQVCDDVLNGVSLHPLLPLLATSSGQRRYEWPPLSRRKRRRGAAADGGSSSSSDSGGSESGGSSESEQDVEARGECGGGSSTASGAGGGSGQVRWGSPSENVLKVWSFRSEALAETAVAAAGEEMEAQEAANADGAAAT